MIRPASKKRSVAWFVAAAVLPVSVFLGTGAVMSIPPDTHGVDTVVGRDLFAAHCSSCHFAKVGFPTHHGPNLHDIGRTAASRQPNQSAAEYILESILDPGAYISPSGRPGMPANVASDLAPDEIRNIVGFLAGKGAFPDYAEIHRLDIPDRRRGRSELTLVRRADMELAERVLREKGACLECHSLHNLPDGQIYAPGLFGVGLVDSQTLLTSVTDPQREIKPKYQSITVALADGRLVAGRLMAKTETELVLCTRDANNRLVVRQIPTSEVEVDDGQLQVYESRESLMPTGFDKLLTREEIEAVITLIRQLN